MTGTHFLDKSQMFTATFLLLLLAVHLSVCRCDTATAHNADLSAAVKDVPLTAELDGPTSGPVVNASLADTHGMALGVLGDEASDENMVPWEAELDIFVRNADANQPLLQAMDGAMPAEEFQALQDCLRDHPMRKHNVNSGDTFAGTTGFLLSFTSKGEQRFRDNADFNCLESYLDRYKVTGTNGWVLNMVWAEVTDYTRELAIKLHTDDCMFVVCISTIIFLFLFIKKVYANNKTVIYH